MNVDQERLVYITIEQFCNRTSLSESTVRRRIRDGHLSHWQPGGPKTLILIPIDCLPSFANAPLSSPMLKSPVMTKDPNTETISGPEPSWKKR